MIHSKPDRNQSKLTVCNGKDPDDSLISSPLLQEYIATQNIQQETEGTNFPPNLDNFFTVVIE